MKWSLSCLAILLLLQACQNTPPKSSSELPNDYNPMPEIWAGIARKIDSLEERRASPEEWRKAAGEHQIISTESALQSIFIGVAEEARGEILKTYRQYGYAEYYGFECDYGALVFFAKGRTEKAFKKG